MLSHSNSNFHQPSSQRGLFKLLLICTGRKVPKLSGPLSVCIIIFLISNLIGILVITDRLKYTMKNILRVYITCVCGVQRLCVIEL